MGAVKTSKVQEYTKSIKDLKNPWVLAQEIPKMTILFFCMVHYMTKWWPKYKLTNNFDVIVAAFEGTHVKMYCKESSYRKAAMEVADKILNKPSWALRQLQKIEVLSGKFMLNSDKLLNLKEANHTELSKQFKITNRYNLESQVLGAAFTWLTEARYEVVTKRLIQLIREQINKTRSKRDPIQVFNVLTKSEKKSHSYNEEFQLLQIIKGIQQNTEIRNKFRNNNIESLTKYALSKKDNISKSIIELHRNWCWLSYGYTGPEKKLADYVKDLKEAITKNLNVADLLKEKKNEDLKLSSKQIKIITELNFNKLQKNLIYFVKESSFLKDYRKGAVYHGMYCYNRFFKQISKDIGIDSKYFWNMNPFEIAALLESNVKVPINELKNRGKSCVLIYGGKDINILYGAQANKILNSMIIELEPDKDEELTGIPVCIGHAKGKAKLIESTDDLHKMNKGDIMISHITYPNLVPAMKKASAIVTNVGGVICHAAIISRELNIPCIVGTKFATKKIKDGDTVEVNAKKGIIKIISRK